MTVSARQGAVPVNWFLIARGGTSTIRISSGLTLREDPATGELQVLSKQSRDGWLRFEITDEALWVQVVSPQWTLMAGKRRQATRWRLDDSVELVLPHHTFQISTSLAGTSRAHCPQIRLQRRPAGDNRPANRETIQPLRSRATERTPEAPPQAVAPVSADDRLKASTLRTEDRRARPARSLRSTHRAGTTLLSTLLLLLAMATSLPARNPTGTYVGAESVTPAAASVASETGTVLLPQVERLLAANPDDASTLEFAVAAYSIEALRNPGNSALAQRLQQLETQLTDSRP